MTNKPVCKLKILIVPICIDTAPIKFYSPGHLSMTDYSVCDVHMSPIYIEKSLNFMNSVIDYKMITSNELTM